MHGSYYGWQYLQSGDRTRNDCVYGILKLYTTFGTLISCKTSFCTHNKTKHTKKENQYEPNSKKNPVWNKLQSQLLIMCRQVGSSM